MESKEPLAEVKARFEAVSKGRYYPKKVTPLEARERLRETDPGIDISPILRARGEEDLKRAALSLLAQSADPKMVSYLSPVIIEAISAFLAFAEKEPKKG